MHLRSILLLFALITYGFAAQKTTAQQFQKVTTGVMATEFGQSVGVSWADLNQDGYLDLVVTNFFPDRCYYYVNNGDGTFTKNTTAAFTLTAHNAPSPAIADYDNDGFPDLHIAILDLNNKLFKNIDGNTFTQIFDNQVAQVHGDSRTSAWGDFDNDGLLDLYVVNRFNAPNQLFRNKGNGVFSVVTEGAHVTDANNSNGATWADFDSDGDLDLFVTNSDNQNNALYVNNGNGTFTKDLDSPVSNDGGISVGASWGDYDNDGYLDLFVTNSYGQDNFLYRYDRRKGTFQKIKEGTIVKSGGTSHGSNWVDYDNDGFLDLFVSNRAGEANELYRNNGDGTFDKVTGESIVTNVGASGGAAWADVDSDGDMDVYIADSEGPNDYFLNNGNGNHWLNVRFVGSASNRDGIGVKVAVKTTINGQRSRQYREVMNREGSYGQGSVNVEFGLGDATGIQKMVVLWPSGKTQVFRRLPADQFMTVYEDEPAALLANFAGIDRLETMAAAFDNVDTDAHQEVVRGDQRVLRIPGVSGDGDIAPEDLFASLDDEDENAGRLTEAYGISTYPNPARTAVSFTFTLAEDAAIDLTVYDMLGREVQRRSLPPVLAGNAQLLDVDVSDLPPGVYVYRADFATADGASVAKSGLLNVAR